MLGGRTPGARRGGASRYSFIQIGLGVPRAEAHPPGIVWYSDSGADQEGNGPNNVPGLGF